MTDAELQLELTKALTHQDLEYCVLLLKEGAILTDFLAVNADSNFLDLLFKTMDTQLLRDLARNCWVYCQATLDPRPRRSEI